MKKRQAALVQAIGGVDFHDWDLTQTSPISTTVGGRQASLVTVAGKDGLLRVLDRDTREQLYEVAITTRENVKARPYAGSEHICPGLIGGLEWNGPAYHPVTRTLFVSTVDWCGTFKLDDKAPAYTPNTHYYGGAVVPDPREKAHGWLQALDATSGAVRWKRAAHSAGGGHRGDVGRHALHR